jgi:hypothetical protein
VCSENEFARIWIELATTNSFGENDCLWRIVYQAGPTDVSAHQPNQTVTYFFCVHNNFVVIAQ